MTLIPASMHTSRIQRGTIFRVEFLRRKKKIRPQSSNHSGLPPKWLKLKDFMQSSGKLLVKLLL